MNYLQTAFQKQLQIGVGLIAAISLLFLSAFASLAATDGRISGVVLDITSHIEAGSRSSNVTVSTSSGKYSISSARITNKPSGQWENGDTPKLQVTLKAGAEYFFASGFSAGNVKINGAGGSVTDVSSGSGSSLVISISLAELKNWQDIVDERNRGIAEYEDDWDDEDDYADDEDDWDDEDDSDEDWEDEDDSWYDDRDWDSDQDDDRIQAINRYRNPSSYRRQPTSVKNTEDEDDYGDEDDYADGEVSNPNPSYPASSYSASGSGAWLKDSKGWWYCNPDKSFPAKEWKKIGERWYYFNESGYMVTGWVNWNSNWYYCGSNGAMYVDAITPDGYYVDVNGVWNQP